MDVPAEMVSFKAGAVADKDGSIRIQAHLSDGRVLLFDVGEEVAKKLFLVLGDFLVGYGVDGGV